jgi:Ca2+-binding RTX toxin-like protein
MDLDHVTNIQGIVLGDADTNIVTQGGLVAAEASLCVDASALSAGHDLSWDGSIEMGATAGRFHIIAGAGHDCLIGGEGSDTFDMGTHLTADDTIDGSGIFLQGSETNVLSFTQDQGHADFTHDLDNVTNIQSISLGDASTSIIASNTLATAGQSLCVDASALSGAHALTWNGSAVLGDQYILGSGQADLLTGGAGCNTLFGGGGSDTLTAGATAGNSIFEYKSATDFGSTGDMIHNFHGGTNGDVLDFYSTSLGGSFNTNLHFSTQAGAPDNAQSCLYYDSTAHTLLYDADGTGAGAAVTVAHFETNVTVTAENILVDHHPAG